jgi:UDP-glucose 4-epimerase
MTLSKVVLVGARGFLGSHILAEFGQKQIVQILNMQELENFLAAPDSMQQPCLFIWAASRVNPASASSSPELSKIEFSEFSYFLELLIKARNSFVHKLVLFSSGGCVYSDDTQSFSESSVAHGINEYGRLKLRLEEKSKEFSGPVLVCRIANVYGPGQKFGRGQGVIANWLQESISNQPIHLFGDGTEVRDFIFISDVVSAIIDLLDCESTGIFNIGSGMPISLNSLIDIVSQNANKQLQVIRSPRRSFDRSSYFLNIEKILLQTNWKPKIQINKGIELTYTYLQSTKI